VGMGWEVTLTCLYLYYIIYIYIYIHFHFHIHIYIIYTYTYLCHSMPYIYIHTCTQSYAKSLFSLIYCLNRNIIQRHVGMLGVFCCQKQRVTSLTRSETMAHPGTCHHGPVPQGWMWHHTAWRLHWPGASRLHDLENSGSHRSCLPHPMAWKYLGIT
jgi:hypothetical protein